MGKLERIQEYFLNQNVDIDFWQFGSDILLSALCALLLSRLYINYSKSLSNKKAFASNFVMLTLTTMMIITIVKSSVALSLGLVGALSIVRFRAAIKDPEELVYLFLCISLGLGFGAGHRYITLLFFSSICLTIIIKSKLKRNTTDTGIFLSINGTTLTFDELTQLLKPACDFIELNRVDVADGKTDTYFTIKAKDEHKVQQIISTIKEKDANCSLSFTHSKGLLS